MSELPKISDFEANAKRGDDLDNVRAIAHYPGITVEQVQHAIDKVGPEAQQWQSFYESP